MFTVTIKINFFAKWHQFVQLLGRENLNKMPLKRVFAHPNIFRKGNEKLTLPWQRHHECIFSLIEVKIFIKKY